MKYNTTSFIQSENSISHLHLSSLIHKTSSQARLLKVSNDLRETAAATTTGGGAGTNSAMGIVTSNMKTIRKDRQQQLNKNILMNLTFGSQ